MQACRVAPVRTCQQYIADVWPQKYAICRKLQAGSSSALLAERVIFVSRRRLRRPGSGLQIWAKVRIFLRQLLRIQKKYLYLHSIWRFARMSR